MCVMLRTIFQLTAGRFSHRTCGVGAGVGDEGLELFAFSVSLFQREKEGSDLSHMRHRYMEGQGSRVGVSTTSHFLDLEFGSSRSPRYEMPSEMWSSPGKHRCPYEFRQRKKTQREV